MGPGELVELLSSEDEAAPKPSRSRKDLSHSTKQDDPSFVFLSDDVISPAHPDHDWAAGPSKKRKLSPPPTGQSSSHGVLVKAGHPNSPKTSVQAKAQISHEWAPICDSDPIVFTSSLDAGPEALRIENVAFSQCVSPSNRSDDSLPDDLLSAPVRTTDIRSKLSGRTAVLLASISVPKGKPKLTSDRKRSQDKSASECGVNSRHSRERKNPPGSEHDSKEQSRKDQPKKKRTLTEEERSSIAREKEKDKAAKAQARDVAKAANREQKAKEKEQDKERKRLENEEKVQAKRISADLAEVNRLKLDKKDSTPEMIVDLPASLDGQSVDIQIRECLKNIQVDATLYQSTIPNVVKWRRKMKARWNPDLNRFEPLDHMQIENEKHVMCLMSAKDFVALAVGQNDDQSVETHVTRLKSANDDCVPIYMIEGLQTWIRKNKTAENRAYQAKIISQHEAEDAPHGKQQSTSRKQKPATEIVDEDVIEDALLQLQIMNGCLVHHTNTSVETAEWVANFTQHISTIPYR